MPPVPYSQCPEEAMIVLETLQWALGQGLAIFLILVTVAGAWRFLMGTKTRPGYLDRKAEEQSAARALHYSDVTRLGAESKVRDEMEAESLRILVASGEPPQGAAFLAAAAVYKTAAEVERFKIGMLQSVKIFRRLAAEFPAAVEDLNRLCDEMERKIGDA